MTEEQTSRLELVHLLTELKGRALASGCEKEALDLFDETIQDLKTQNNEERTVVRKNVSKPKAAWSCGWCGSPVEPNYSYCYDCGRQLNWREAMNDLTEARAEVESLPF